MGQRRKHVLQTVFSQDIQPPAENQQIVRAVGARGGNIIEVHLVCDKKRHYARLLRPQLLATIK